MMWVCRLLLNTLGFQKASLQPALSKSHAQKGLRTFRSIAKTVLGLQAFRVKRLQIANGL